MKNDFYVIVAGYASTFNHVDRSNHIISFKAFEYQTEKIPILFQHNRQKFLGHLLYSRTDQYGLYIEAALMLDTPLQKHVLNLIENNEVFGMSVGIEVEEAKRKMGMLFIKKAKLLEISITTNPVNSLCTIDFCKKFKMVGDSGIEPPTSTMST